MTDEQEQARERVAIEVMDLEPGEAMADFALEQYGAGQRAERERIVLELDELLGDVGDGKLARFMDDLRADPAESRE